MRILFLGDVMGRAGRKAITENLPQTRGFMASYVMTVDKLRLTLNEVIMGFRAG